MVTISTTAPVGGISGAPPGSNSNTSPRNEDQEEEDEGVIMITKRQSGIAPMAQTQVFNHYNTSSQNVLSSHNIITYSQHTLSTHCVPLITVCLVLTSTSTHPFSSSIISYPSNILPSYTLSTHHLIFSTTYHLPTHPLLHSSLPTHPLLNPSPSRSP